MAVKENKMIAKAKQEYEYLTGDAAVRRIAFLRDKWERDHNSDIAWNRKQAKLESKKEIAKNLLKEKIPVEIIIKVTGLKEEEIKKIENQIS